MKVINEYLDITEQEFIDYVLYESFQMTESQLLESKIPDIKKYVVNLKNSISKYKKHFNETHITLRDIKASTKKMKPAIINELKKAKKDNVKQIGNNVLHIVKSEMQEMTMGKKIGESLMILLFVIVLNTLLAIVAAAIVTIVLAPFGVPAATIGVVSSAALACIIAPVVEEWAKRKAIKAKMPWVYTTVFGMFEFAQYTFAMMISGGNIPAVLAARGAALGMHYFTTFIQKKFQDLADKKHSEALSKLGFVIAILIHAFWNALALIFNGEISEWIGLPTK